jgi:hypothetical protein
MRPRRNEVLAAEAKRLQDIEERRRREELWKHYGFPGVKTFSSSSSHGQRLSWMRQQADRLDPLAESPPSVLDRKHELRYW